MKPLTKYFSARAVAGQLTPFLLLFVLGTGIAAAHEERHDTITDRTNTELSEAEQAIRQGEIYRRQSNWDAAIAAFEKARELGANENTVNLYIGRTWLFAGDPAKALDYLNRFIKTHPNDVGARQLRANALARLDKHQAAADELQIAIDLQARPPPDLFVAHARQLSSTNPPHTVAALNTLQNGMRLYGPVMSLADETINVHVQMGEYANALEVMDGQPEMLRFSAPWLKRRGDIQALAGDDELARETYVQAMESLNSLPEHMHSMPDNVKLRKELEEKLAAEE
ncbi:MAG: tetratricopeptide repeat protein [Gammaproteobacteria bacterium]